MDTNEDNTLVIEYNGPSLQEQVVASIIVTVVATAAPFIVIGVAAGVYKGYSWIRDKVANRKSEDPLFTE